MPRTLMMERWRAAVAEWKHRPGADLLETIEAHGLYVIDPDEIDWDAIHAYQTELRRGQDVREGAGGFFARAIRALLRIGRPPEDVRTYRRAAQEMLDEISRR